MREVRAGLAVRSRGRVDATQGGESGRLVTCVVCRLGLTVSVVVMVEWRAVSSKERCE